ncbi:MAG: starch-binding protein [Oscillospiraceae bacterium]|nr:starch-binding protein [Candidatus Ruminococcus equi]
MKLSKKVISLVLTLALIVSCVTVVCVSTSAYTGDGSTTEALGGYYSTNLNDACGVRKTISIDGDISDWDSSMLIAQGVANDDPRVYRPSSMHEVPVDSYALYACWDDDNLYLMWEMKNLQDIVAPNDDYPLSQGWLYDWADMPYYLVFDLGSGKYGDGTVANGETIWQSGITFDTHIDTWMCNSMNFWNGPYIYKTNDQGKFVYNETKHSEIKMEANKNQSVSTHIYGIEGGYGKYHNRVPGDTLLSTSNWMDYSETKHDTKLDYFYEIAIPLSTLGITDDYIENTGIGVMHIQSFGTSGMNSLPFDPSMTDNADKEYTKEPSGSNEKEDEDHITVPLARIGVCSGSVHPTLPSVIPTQAPSSQETQPTSEIPTEKPTQAPTHKPGTLILGDVDLDSSVTITDATMIQKALAKIFTLTDAQALCADINSDGVDITDATLIQKYLAKYTIPYPIGEPIGEEPTETPTQAPTEAPTQAPTSSDIDFSDPNTIFVCDDAGWNSVYIHYWGSAETKWPGEQMQKVGTYNGYDLYSYTLTTSVDGIVINIGSNQNQTRDLTPPGAYKVLLTSTKEFTDVN